MRSNTTLVWAWVLLILPVYEVMSMGRRVRGDWLPLPEMLCQRLSTLLSELARRIEE